MTENQYVKSTCLDNGLSIITFYNKKGNALSSSLLKKTKENIAKQSQNDKIKIILLKSKGDKAFCSGAFFDELLDIKTKQEGKEFFMGFGNLIYEIYCSPKTIITQVQSKVVGGGVGLVCSSDYSIASKSADMKLSEINLGIAPFVIGPIIEHKVGKSVLNKMTLDANWKTSKWCYKKGFYDTMVDDDKLENSVEIFINNMLEKNFEALLQIKKLKNNINHSEFYNSMEKRAELSGKLILSKYSKTFLSKFKEHKRK